ncbi:MAG: ferredoxin--NADP reductase [Cytophagales bacterium]|nr:ferredoxin--NADP reductase [Cytophagales bacterium]MDW8384120.1 ferredoxin--NADP reductase [Flammeovirgaceae bacterium]
MSDYFTLKVIKVIPETSDTVTIQLKQPFFKKVKYKAGQFLTILLTIDGKKVRRSYSMSSAPQVEDYLAITVKRVAGGLVSNYLNDKVKEDDSLEFMEPMGNFYIEPDKDKQRHITLLGAGSGITPLMSIAKAVLYAEPKSTVSLLYGSRNEQSIIFKSALDDLKSKFKERFQVVHSLSQPFNEDWNGFKGRISEAHVINFINLVNKKPAENTLYYICGPEGMMREAQNALKRLRVPQNQIFIESFTPHQEETTSQNTEILDQEVSIIHRGETHKIFVPKNKTILEIALEHGLDMPYSCQSGVCTACMAKCRSGKVYMSHNDGLSEADLQKGYVLLCTGHPLTHDVIVEIE